ncbi:ISA2 [Candida theae]|uniref:ISA2 n=1 Tax=Candida theae TaxID=1198502 RepID=A0AAD5BGE4_9ASCO|nr:ISA2 [Candida theae]KAI5961495.1 ISA2 [Candida theae]
MSLRHLTRTKPLSRSILYSLQPYISRLSPIRWNSSPSSPPSSTPKTLKPSSFAFPTDPPAAPAAPAAPTAPKKQHEHHEQHEHQGSTTSAPGQVSDDFKATSLTHGKTDKVIAITPRACAKLQSIKLENPKDTALQIQVESGGCHGFQYNLHLINLDEYLAGDKSDDVFVFERDGAHIALDDSSLTILQESKLDYTKELIGSQFKIVDSPYTSTACGCGASFDFDFDKLEQNQKSRG